MIRCTKSILVPVTLALGALAPLAASATDPLSYSYVEGQYLNSSLKAGPKSSLNKGKEKDETEGYRVAINVSLYRFVYFAGEADKIRASKYRYGTQSVGLGAHTEPTFTPHLQLFGVASYERRIYNDVTGFIKDDADEGYGVQGGVRVPYDNFEFTAAYRYMGYGKTDDLKVTGDKYAAGFVVQLTPFFGLTADYGRFDLTAKGAGPKSGIKTKDEFDQWTVGFRSYFATDIDRYRRRGGFFGSGE